MRSSAPYVLILSLFVGTAASAQSKALLAPFSGPKATVARGQLLKSVCEEVECVPVTKGTTKGKPDWEKLKKLGVSTVVTGKVVAGGKKIEIGLVQKAGKKPVWKKSFAVKAGKLAPAALDEISEKVADVLGGGGGRGNDDDVPVAAAGGDDDEGDSADVDPPAATSSSGLGSASSSSSSSSSESGFGQRSEDDSGSSASSSSFADPTASASSRDSDRSSVSGGDSGSDADLRGSAEEPKAPPGAFPLFAVSGGLELLNRSYAVSGLQTANLRDYSAPLIIAPHLRLEGHPLTNKGGMIAGLGLELDFALSLALKSGLEGGPTFPTSMSRFDLGAFYAWRPIAGSSFTVAPHLGFRKQSFSVGKAGDGTELDGLPNISYGGIRVAVSADYAVGERLALFGVLGFLPGLSTGAIGSAPFFPGAKANGLELGGGAGYLLTDKVELRAALQLTSYSLSFAPETGAAFVADGASDRYLGGVLTARYKF